MPQLQDTATIFFGVDTDSLGVLFVQVATDLTTLLDMPVKLEGCGEIRRLLEVKVAIQTSKRVHAELAFRDDADRQGESNDVTSWHQGMIHVFDSCFLHY